MEHSVLSPVVPETRTSSFSTQAPVNEAHSRMLLRPALLAVCLVAGIHSVAQRSVSSERLVKEVRHHVLMLPYFNVFDNIAFKLDGYNVTLLGQVTRPSLKTDAEAAVREIEGVETVDNQIEVLPVSTFDERLRLKLFQAIYGYAPLQRYALGVIKPIRIIVKSGQVSLEGVVDSESDKNLVGMRANGVSGAFSVTNNLEVPKDGPSKPNDHD
jgi:hyperosmotically inducible protein